MPAATHWTQDVENILKKIRLHSLMRSKYHQTSYFNMNRLLKYFRIPVIVLSAVSSVFSVVLPQYMNIETSSMICCFISLTVGLIGSIEMFLQIQKRMEIDLHNAKSFGILATDITKMLNLSFENRTVDGLSFLEEKMNEYNSLVDLSIVIDIQLHEKILELNLIDNLTEEEELSILTNDNLQSIFRRYKLLFLTKRRLELRDGKPESDTTNSSSNKTPRRVISNLIKKTSSSNLSIGHTQGTLGGMTDAEMDRDIDSITRNRSSSRTSILSSFASAIRGVSRTATPNLSIHPPVPPVLQMPVPTYPPPISTPIAKTPNIIQTPISRTPTQRRSGSRPGQSMVNSQSLQNTHDFAAQLRTKLETLHESKDETELSTPTPGLPLYDNSIQMQIDIESGLNPKSDSRSSQSSISKDDIEYKL